MKETGLSRDTIRYYEKYGLLEVEIRRDNNYKEYSEQSVNLLLAVGRLKKHGYSLREIREFIELFTNSQYSCRATAPLIETKLRDLKQKIDDLKQVKKNLESALRKCQDHPNGKACRVLGDFFDV